MQAASPTGTFHTRSGSIASLAWALMIGPGSMPGYWSMHGTNSTRSEYTAEEIINVDGVNLTTGRVVTPAIVVPVRRTVMRNSHGGTIPNELCQKRTPCHQLPLAEPTAKRPIVAEFAQNSATTISPSCSCVPPRECHPISGSIPLEAITTCSQRFD